MGDRIRRRRESLQIDARELASQAGIAYSTLMDLENGRSKGTTKLPNIIRVLRTSQRYLETGKGDPDAVEYEDAEWANVMGFAQAVGLGEGQEAQEYAETHKLKFRSDSLARKRLNPAKLGVMYGKGDSMLPRIRPGDAILFDTSDTRPADECLFLILVQGLAGDGYSVKRCRMIGDLVVFEALNPEGEHTWRKPRRMDDPAYPIKIIGRVRWIGSWEG